MGFFSKLFGKREEQSLHPKDSVLGRLINMGAFPKDTGSHEVGYFNPNTRCFYALSSGIGMLGHTETEKNTLALIEEAAGDSFVLSTVDMMLSSGTTSPSLAVKIKLRISSSEEILKHFRAITQDQSVSAFMMATTVMPFFLKYTDPSRGKVSIISELAEEIMFNALANMLLKDDAFKNVHTVKMLNKVACSLMETRKSEYEKKKQWAIDFKREHFG